MYSHHKNLKMKTVNNLISNGSIVKLNKRDERAIKYVSFLWISSYFSWSDENTSNHIPHIIQSREIISKVSKRNLANQDCYKQNNQV